MVTIDKAVIARIKKNNYNFEILVDCLGAISFQKKGGDNINDIIASENIYSDAKKGHLVKESELKIAFGNKVRSEILKEILLNCNLPRSKQQISNEKENKNIQILNFICKNAIDPRTNKPHPKKRIENAMLEAKIKIQDKGTIEKISKEIIEKIRPILPIRFEDIKLEITVKEIESVNFIKKNSKIISEYKTKNGEYHCIIQIQKGQTNEFTEKLLQIAPAKISQLRE